jgi:hypothetical protein
MERGLKLKKIPPNRCVTDHCSASPDGEGSENKKRHRGFRIPDFTAGVDFSTFLLGAKLS